MHYAYLPVNAFCVIFCATRWKTEVVMRFAIVGAALILGACASSEVSRQSINSVEAGMTKAEVVSLLGEPGNRSFRGNAEALQYCDGSVMSEYNTYHTIWLAGGAVIMTRLLPWSCPPQRC